MDILSLSPNATLDFVGPFTQAIKPTVQLAITNSTGNTLHFRIKTTAPKLYAARPGVGKIRKWESVVVYITLHGLVEEPPASLKCKDKFLIQAFTVTSDQEHLDGKELWELAYKDASEIHVHQRKLRVVYLPPGEAPASAEGEGGVEEALSIHVEEPQKYDSDNPTIDRLLIEAADRQQRDPVVQEPVHVDDDSTNVEPKDENSPEVPLAPSLVQVSHEISVAHTELGLAESRSSSDSDQNSSPPRIQEVEVAAESTVQRKRSLDMTDEMGALKSLKLDELMAVEEKTITITEVITPEELRSPVPIHERGVPVWIVCIMVSTTFIFTYIFL
ncbi:hypothetical protein NLJ89_g2579 [Agrocybe chaxingu]|uniref:MSP domain-containing protein n=1 Tax=Agrocybe chaxingu TaxID=84603 RepID=A0A9W8K447_9AGAR|nr:hypothetical protein NLJ89_g2579 [Agrocybe chaxingu]